MNEGTCGPGLWSIQSDVAIMFSSSSAAKTNSALCHFLRSCESTITTRNCAKHLSLPDSCTRCPVMADPRTCSQSSSYPFSAKVAVTIFTSFANNGFGEVKPADVENTLVCAVCQLGASCAQAYTAIERGRASKLRSKSQDTSARIASYRRLSLLLLFQSSYLPCSIVLTRQWLHVSDE